MLDFPNSFREVFRAEMDDRGRLNEAGLALALNRRPHLAAVLRLLSKSFERLVEGGYEDNFLLHAPPDVKLAIDELRTEAEVNECMFFVVVVKNER
jgi:hypothetical protein